MCPLSINSVKEFTNIFGKYLDQPALVQNIYQKMPVALTSIALGYGAYDTFQTPKGERGKRAIKNASVLGATVASALIATRGLKIKGKEIFEGIIELPEKDEEGLKELLTKPLSQKIKGFVQKIQDDKVLALNEVKEMMSYFKKNFEGEDLISKAIPAPESEAPFSDLWKLSKLGLIPVLGGIAGGTIGDKLAGENWKKQFPDKVKEGTYQYLNNIALCNVGAGLGALTMNVCKVKSKLARVGAMLTGVVGVGLVAGNAIANLVGKEVINPMFDKDSKPSSFGDAVKHLNSERHPEALDLSLHIDDLASVGFISGLKWIGPVLPMLYSVSAYRAGIGYRNGKTYKEQNKISEK